MRLMIYSFSQNAPRGVCDQPVHNASFAVLFTHFFAIERNLVLAQLERFSNLLVGLVDVVNRYQAHSHSIILQRFTSVASFNFRKGN